MSENQFRIEQNTVCWERRNGPQRSDAVERLEKERLLSGERENRVRREGERREADGDGRPFVHHGAGIGVAASSECGSDGERGLCSSARDNDEGPWERPRGSDRAGSWR
jgi:hypothetical protein